MNSAINPPVQRYEGVLPINIELADGFSTSLIDFPWPAGTTILSNDLGQLAAPVSHLASDARETIEIEFRSLANQWNVETGYHSSLAKKFTHPAYQRIMAMGREALPLILSELRDNPDHWFYALRMIVGRDIAEGTENFDDARAAWLYWGYQENHI